MKLSAYGILATTSGMGVTDLLDGPLAIQYGALAILGGILAYLLGWTLPAIIGAQRDQRTDFLAAQVAASERAAEAARATRHDFRDALAGNSRAIDCLAAAISEARRSAGQ
jgi:hypothetical protein